LANGKLFVPGYQLILSAALILTSFCIVRLRSMVHPFIYLFLIINLSSVLTLLLPGVQKMSNVFGISQTFTRNTEGLALKYDSVKEKRYWDARIRSFPKMKSTVGPFYHMETKAKFTIAENLISGITFMLITFN